MGTLPLRSFRPLGLHTHFSASRNNARIIATGGGRDGRGRDGKWRGGKQASYVSRLFHFRHHAHRLFAHALGLMLASRSNRINEKISLQAI